jgi:hypothetical protein
MLGGELEIRRAQSSTQLYKHPIRHKPRDWPVCAEGSGLGHGVVYARSALPSWQMQATLRPKSSRIIVVEPASASDFVSRAYAFASDVHQILAQVDGVKISYRPYCEPPLSFRLRDGTGAGGRGQ